MLPDPERRDDNRCAQPGCTKALVKITKRHKRYGGTALLEDPFCSTECCKAFHGVDISRDAFNEGRGQDGYLYEWHRANPDKKHRAGKANRPVGLKEKEPPDHGTYASYSTWLCRCPLCREANRAYHREHRALKRAEKQAA